MFQSFSPCRVGTLRKIVCQRYQPSNKDLHQLTYENETGGGGEKLTSTIISENRSNIMDGCCDRVLKIVVSSNLDETW